MGLNVSGLVSLLLFYILILLIGIAAYWKKGRKKNTDEHGSETITVARRDIGWIVGGFSMIGERKKWSDNFLAPRADNFDAQANLLPVTFGAQGRQL